MNSTSFEAIIQEYYYQEVTNWITISSLTLLLYATVLRFSQEVEHIWSRSFTLPTLLYIFARYGAIISSILYTPLTFIAPGRTCNMLDDALDATKFLAYFGVQGLLVARGYSMCKGNKFVVPVLCMAFLSSIISNLYGTISFHGCISSENAEQSGLIRATTAINSTVILTDAIIFTICMWKILDTWKLKRENVRIQSHRNLVSVLLTQGISRFLFVTIMTITGAVLLVPHINNALLFFVVSQGFASFQNALSTILVADSTLDLRQLNSTQIEASNMSLPTLQITKVIQHVHQSLVVELATPGDISALDLEDGDDHGHTSTPEFDIDDIQPIQ